jgi:hypothetical protein
MKRLIVLAAFLAALSPFLTSCEQEMVEQTAPPRAPQPEMSFSTVVRVPLYGGSAVIGEDKALNQNIIERENKALLKPAFVQVWEDAQAGKYPTYPILSDFPEGVTEKDFGAHMIEKLEKSEIGFNEKCMLLGLELDFKGQSFKGGSKLKAEWLHFVWIDVDEKYPDRNMFKVRIADLAPYQIQTPNGPVTLTDYFNARDYESYPIRVANDKGAIGMRSYEEAREAEVLIAHGELDQFNFPN